MIQILAEIELFKGTDKRQHYFTSGYRPQFNFMEKTSTSGAILLLDRDKFHPGDKGKVEIVFLNNDYLGDKFQPNEQVSFSEGKEILGNCVILEILNKQ